MRAKFRAFLAKHSWAARLYALFAAVVYVPLAILCETAALLWEHAPLYVDEHRVIIRVLITGRMPR